ncbi:DUF4129 domain-containing protein [Hymenobacter sp. BT507]|uniref:DUF4129 domain-containing protein n=1 Tax=Hymenobacter citatus TaxID=2763506 RepID=A0ABR7MIV4_9BACT|nr:DUF4129 domain-containing protein [Hymenobacter citatus]MBC6610784.1 DUF4129 domain-containing protein [Hymenobacter citatus]
MFRGCRGAGLMVLVLLLFLTALPLTSTAAPDDAPAVTLPAYPRPAPTLRQPAPGRLARFREQRAFQYVQPEPKRTTAWDLFWWRLMQWIRALFDSKGYQNQGRYVVYGLFGLAFLYLLLRVLQLDLTVVLGRKARTVALPYDALLEDIHGLNFVELLAEAEAQANYRLAVRLGYLQSLHALSERHLIDWQPDKTNHHYLLELTNTPWQAPFADLTRQFEYVWYGEQPLTARLYEQLRATRQEFLGTLTQRAA